MTIATQINKVTYQGNGSTREFPFSFPVYDADHIKVVLVDSDEAETELAATAYTVDLDTMSVTYPKSSTGAALPSGTTLTILRELPLTQETDLENQGPLEAEVLERQYDKIVMMIQQHQEAIERSVKAPVDQTDATAFYTRLDAAMTDAEEAIALAQATGEKATTLLETVQSLVPYAETQISDLTADSLNQISAANDDALGQISDLTASSLAEITATSDAAQAIITADRDAVESLYHQVGDLTLQAAQSTVEARAVLQETKATLADTESVLSNTESVLAETKTVLSDTQTVLSETEAVRDEAAASAAEAAAIAASYTYMGQWNNTTTYAKNNVVSYLGSSFISRIDDNVGNQPNHVVATDAWGLLAIAGEGVSAGYIDGGDASTVFAVTLDGGGAADWSDE